MHIGFAVFGTRGDIGPLSWMASALLQRGHRVTFFVNPHFAHIPKEPLAFVGDAAAERLQVVEVGDPWDPKDIVAQKEALDPRKVWTTFFMPQLPAFVRAQRQVHANDPLDGIVAHIWTYGAVLAALADGIPFGFATLQPITWLSASLPARLDAWDMPQWLRRPVMGTFFPWVVRRCFDPPLRQAAVVLGVDLAALGASPFFGAWEQAACHLGLWDNAFRPLQDDDPSGAVLTGFALEPSQTPLDDELDAFCRRHRPWVMGLGSALPLHFQQPYLALARATDEPMVLVGADRTTLTEELGALPSHIHVVDYAPYASLFRLARGVLHHGGVGTVAQALDAGVPQAVLGFGNDMFDNGERVQEMGCGVVGDGRKVTPKKLRRMLARLREDDVIGRAKEVQGQRPAPTAWTDVACVALETAFAKRAKPSA